MDSNEERTSSEERMSIIQNQLLESLFSDKEIIVKEEAKNELALATMLSEILSGYNVEIDELDEHFLDEEDSLLDKAEAHPLILQEHAEALTLLNELLLSADKVLETYKSEESVCPYENCLTEYLGSNFVVPSIHELTIPKDFSLIQSVNIVENHIQKIDDLMEQQFEVMLREARDTNFPGITSEHVGNAFAILSATKDGEKFVLNRTKLAQHLEFAEIVRNLPTEEVMNNPWSVAFKLIDRYAKISVD